MKKQPPASSADQTDSALKAIYEDLPNGEETNMATLQRQPARKGRMVFLIIFGVIFLASIIALVAFFFFNPKKQNGNASVAVTVATQDNATSGDTISVVVTVKNNGSVDLKSASVGVEYPDGFQFASSTPTATNDFHNSWSLGAVAAGQEKSVHLSGTLTGEVGQTKTFHATATYQPQNFSSTFVVEGTKTVTLSTSIFDLTIKAPTSAASGQSATYLVTAKNTSKNTVNSARLEMDFPSALTAITADPAASENKNVWNIPTLAAGAEYAVTIKGTITGSASDSVELKARIGVVDDSGTFQVQREQSSIVVLLAPTLNVTMTVNGAKKPTPAKTGDALSIVLNYSNDGESVFTDATLVLAFPGTDSNNDGVSLVDATSIASKTSFLLSDDDHTITWTKDTFPDLARIVPGGKGSVTVTIPIKKSLRNIGSGKNYTLSLTGSVASGVEDGAGTYKKTTDALTIPILTQLRLASEARYYSDEGAPIGTGSLPPQAGSATQYHINWFATNTYNDAKNVVVTATLPQGVDYVSGNSSLVYDAPSHTIQWKPGTVLAGVGESIATLQASFVVSVTPQSSDVGRTLSLLSTSTLTGTDTFTSSALSATTEALSSDLTYDPYAAGKGIVVAATDANANVNAQ